MTEQLSKARDEFITAMQKYFITLGIPDSEDFKLVAENMVNNFEKEAIEMIKTVSMR